MLANCHKMNSPTTSLVSAGRRISKRYSKVQLKRMRRHECRILKKLVPGVSNQNRISEVTVIEEAIKHISELEEAVLMRLMPTNCANEDGSAHSTVSPTPTVPVSFSQRSETAQRLIQSLLPTDFLQNVLKGRSALPRPSPSGHTFPQLPSKHRPSPSGSSSAQRVRRPNL